ARGLDVVELLDHFRERADVAERYVEAYRRYCWPVHSLDDLKLAPFHILASEGAVHINRDHIWHMDTLTRVCKTDPALLLATPYLIVDLNDEASVARGTTWWEELTAHGGEGMVVKPYDFILEGKKDTAQPAVK